MRAKLRIRQFLINDFLYGGREPAVFLVWRVGFRCQTAGAVPPPYGIGHSERSEESFPNGKTFRLHSVSLKVTSGVRPFGCARGDKSDSRCQISDFRRREQAARPTLQIQVILNEVKNLSPMVSPLGKTFRLHFVSLKVTKCGKTPRQAQGDFVGSG